MYKEVDNLIIGAGIAGMILSYKLSGNNVLLDKSPFSYKIGESHLPNLLHSDEDLIFLKEYIEGLDSYSIKRGSVFVDNSTKKHTALSIPLGRKFAFHAERIELEKLLSEKLSVDIVEEKVIDIDYEKNIVITNKSEYKVKKFIFDCSGFSMFTARKLNLLTAIDGYDTSTKWGYWNIKDFKNEHNSFSYMTILTKINKNTWMWQIPLYNNTVLSCGIVSNGKKVSDTEYTNLIINNKYSGYEIEKINLNGVCDKNSSTLDKIYSRANFSNYSTTPIINNTILLGDAYCFADPVFSSGTGVSSSQAIYLANKINDNSFTKDEYINKTSDLLSSIKEGIDMWYNGSWDKGHNLEYVSKGILQGNILDEYVKSDDLLSMHDKQIKMEFLFAGGKGTNGFLFDINDNINYFFDKKLFSSLDKSLIFGNINIEGLYVKIKNLKIIGFMIKYLYGQTFKMSFVKSLAYNNLSKGDYDIFIKCMLEVTRKGILEINFNK